MLMAPTAGLEPATSSLTARRSTTELSRNSINSVNYNETDEFRQYANGRILFWGQILVLLTPYMY